MNMIKENNASGFILFNAILWGSSYIWSKMLLGYLPYFTVLFFYSIGGLALLSILFFKRIKGISRKTILIGTGIGVLSVLSNIFCMLALSSTSSSNTAFIVQMSVILTPMIMSVAERKLPGGRVVTSALAALAGLLLLTFDFSKLSMNPGDLFALANALFFSLYLASLKIFAGKTDPAQFTVIQHVTSSVAFLALALFLDRGHVDFGKMNLLSSGILVLSIFISVSTILIQSTAIRFIRPEKATVIYTMEPVAAAVFAYFLIGERMTGIRALIGCVLILAAIVMTAYKKRSTQKTEKIVQYKYWQLPALKQEKIYDR